MKHFINFVLITALIWAGALYLTEHDDSIANKTKKFYTEQKATASAHFEKVQEEILLVQQILKDLKAQEDEDCQKLRQQGEQKRHDLKAELTAAKTEEEIQREELRQSYSEIKSDLQEQKRDDHMALMKKRADVFTELVKKEEGLNTKLSAISDELAGNKTKLIKSEESLTYSTELASIENTKKRKAMLEMRKELIQKNLMLTEAIQKERDEFQQYKNKAQELIRKLDIAVHKNDRAYRKKTASLTMGDPARLYKQKADEIAESLQVENQSILDLKEKYHLKRKDGEAELKLLHEEKNKIVADLGAAINALKEPAREDLDKKTIINGLAVILTLLIGIIYFFTLRASANLME